MANPTTNYSFQMPTASDLVTDLPADFETFGQAVDTRLKALQPGTTLGDLAYSSATADTNTRLGIGTNGDVLTVAGGVPTWAAPSGGGNFPKLSFVTPSGNFSSSSTSYTDVTGYTITITPVSATNTIQITANLAVQIGTSSNTEFRILVDGVAQGGRIEAPLEATEGEVTVIAYVSNLAASAKVCKLQMRAAGGVSTTVYGSSSGYVSNFGVLEIY